MKPHIYAECMCAQATTTVHHPPRRRHNVASHQPPYTYSTVGTTIPIFLVSFSFHTNTMTTAHRPTWKAAVGRSNQGGWSAGGAVSTAVSALEAPGQLSLKHLRKPVDKKKALRESLLALEKAEAKALPKRKLDPAIEERAEQRLLKQSDEDDVDVKAIAAKYDDSDVDDGGGHSDADHKPEEDDTDLDESDSDLDSDSSDEEDDEEALQAELAKIRKEREEARRKAEEEQAEENRQRDESAALVGNPLLAAGAASTGGHTKRRWNEDVVFRNQAKGEPKPKKRFINDTVRNDFHKRFLNKFIR